MNRYLDGTYEVRLMTKAELKYTGHVKWTPPAIYKSSCQVNLSVYCRYIRPCLFSNTRQSNINIICHFVIFTFVPFFSSNHRTFVTLACRHNSIVMVRCLKCAFAMLTEI